ncbi:hypothetical protein L596_006404 [Steinernema carpocapsae]|uniref:Uncharacterized protein n=1 Tax=Steinernema carpocapsae TaxID=34508 RepID=A0A4U8V8P5_STECR|nr:hypothetical protein L596_006404 [Steinernema carpocapsae]
MTTACHTTIACSEHRTQSSILLSTGFGVRAKSPLKAVKAVKHCGCLIGILPVSQVLCSCSFAWRRFCAVADRVRWRFRPGIDDCVWCSLYAMVVRQAVVMVRTLREPMTEHYTVNLTNFTTFQI